MFVQWEKKNMLVPLRSLRDTDECTSQLSCIRGKVESVQVFRLEAEAFPQGVIQNFWCQLTQCYCTRTGKQTAVVEMRWLYLCSTQRGSPCGWEQTRGTIISDFSCFLGCANQNSFLFWLLNTKYCSCNTFCIAATILCKTDYGSNDYYVDLMETDLNLRESWHKLCFHYRVAQNLSNMFKMSMKHSCEMVGFGWCYATDKHKIPRSLAVDVLNYGGKFFHCNNCTCCHYCLGQRDYVLRAVLEKKDPYTCIIICIIVSVERVTSKM